MPLINRVGGGGAELQSKSVDITNPSYPYVTVTPDEGFDGLSQVTANAKLIERSVNPGTEALQVDPLSGYVGLSRVYVAPAFKTAKTTGGATLTISGVVKSPQIVIAMTTGDIANANLADSAWTLLYVVYDHNCALNNYQINFIQILNSGVWYSNLGNNTNSPRGDYDSTNKTFTFTANEQYKFQEDTNYLCVIIY